MHFEKDALEASRTVSAEMVAAVIHDSQRVEIRNAIITGLLNLRNTTLTSEIIFLNCRFAHGVDFSYATLGRNLTLSSCELAGTADFRSLSCKYDVQLDNSLFDCNASFMNIHVDGNFSACQAQFQGPVRFDDAEFGPDVDFASASFESASFDSVKIKGSGHFGETIFEHQADFSGLEADGEMDFRGSRFKDEQSPAVFDVIQVDGDLSFENAIFTGSASFDGARVQGSASFENTSFAQDVNCDDMKVDGDLVFEGAKIDGKGEFVGLDIGGGAIFYRTEFRSAKKIRFDLTHFGGGVFFQGAKFTGEVDFKSVEISLAARFSGSEFNQAVSFEASKFTGLANFNSGDLADLEYPGASFNDFSAKHTRFEHDAHFEDALFRGNADFRDATFQVVYFAGSGKVEVGNQTEEQFQSNVDLRGCTYKAISADWRSLLLDSTAYNRQPYTQLEKFFTNAGETELADEVYLERRQAERKWKWSKKRYFSWLRDLLYSISLRYGVRPVRLLFLSVALLVLGTLFFSLPYTVSADKKPIAPGLSYADSFEFSVHQFLPVDIPLGGDWTPSTEAIVLRHGHSIRPTTFAGLFLRLPGWILVPVAIASFTSLLRGASGNKSNGGEE